MKKQKVITIAPKAEHSSTYVFYNTNTKISLFVDAWGADEIYDIFDECGFEDRSAWKIFLELNNQPAG